MKNVDVCPCGRVLQPNSMAEMTGLCDHCREVAVLERTPLAQRAFVQRMTRAELEACDCEYCVEQWERYS